MANTNILLLIRLVKYICRFVCDFVFGSIYLCKCKEADTQDKWELSDLQGPKWQRPIHPYDQFPERQEKNTCKALNENTITYILHESESVTRCPGLFALQ